MSFAVKYRPKDFNSVVGQKFVKETLREAIKQDKLVWAYLLCGPRWTGKTSIARIFAKSINCLNPVDWNPCHKCEICQAFNENKLIDIIEIDAASHTGVDNIRDIIEKAQFVPNKAKYKVYIIDEVHMLSTWAFNALLKILEEPPSFVKFVLATTEIQKIPETILSRCQRYDFKNIDSQDIKNQLEFIAKKEKIKVDEDSLDFIVKNASGGLRNAIVSFEQYIVWDEINYSNIIKNIWITEVSFLKWFLYSLVNKDTKIIDDFEEIIVSGKNIKLFYKDLIYLTRDEIIEKIKKWENSIELLQILEILDETYTKTKNSMDEKVTLFSGLLKVVYRDEIGWKTQIENEQNPALISGARGILNNSSKEKINKNINDNSNDSWSSPEWGIVVTSLDKSKNTKNVEEVLDICDIEDIFWSWEEKQENSIESQDFSLENLMNKIKELWWKASINTAIKTWKFNFDWKNLVLIPKTKFEWKSLNDADSRWIICKALEELGFNDVKLKIE